MSKFAPHRKSYNNPRAASTTVCQKCLKTGEFDLLVDPDVRLKENHCHFIYECKSERPYVSRPSRTEMLENPKVLAKLKPDGKPSVEVPEEFKKKSGTANMILEAKEKEREKQKAIEPDSHTRKKARRSSRSSSSSSSESDSSTSDSSASDSGSNSDSESSRSRERNGKRRIPRRPDSQSRSTSRSRTPDSSSERD